MEENNGAGYDMLAEAIIEKSVEDYRKYKRYKKPEERQLYESTLVFFKSDWCDWLLEAIGSQLRGTDILQKIKEVENGRC